MDYIHRLDNFNGQAVAKIAKDDEYKMYEEAFEIYKKFNEDVDAVDVLLNCLDSIERGKLF